jgi:long-chain acyl-CoA synthetase
MSTTTLDPHRIVRGDDFGWKAEVLPFDTIPKMFRLGVSQMGDKPMMRQKDLGIWRAYSWNDVAKISEEIGAGLVSIGFEPGEVASVLANTCREWVWCDLAIQSMGGVCNGIYPTDAASQVQYLCEDSRSVFLFVESDEQLDKYLEVGDTLLQMRKVIVFNMEGLGDLNDPRVMSLEQLRAAGREFLAKHPKLLEERLASRSGNDLAILVYTSGTTGRPKGAMISHTNLCFTLSLASNSIFEGVPEGAERIAFLPLCHIAERMIGGYVPIFRRQIVNFVENPDTVFEDLREVQPHVFFAVPRVWEKIYSQVMITLSEAGKVQQAAYAWALGANAQEVEATAAGRSPGGWTALKARIARSVVINNVRRMVGLDRVEMALTGAAPISADLIRWYQSMGIPLREGWGMTETCGGGTFNPRKAPKPGSVGIPGPGIEMRIAPGTNEIQLRGRNVIVGYLNQPEKTAETIDSDGWLHTGDVGRVDDEGYFYITDRMKDIIITAGGKNVTPSEWENELKFSPYVTDAVVIGDKRAYLTALIMIDQENVEKFAQDHDVPFSNYTSLTRAKEVQDLIQGEIDKANAKFARVEQVKKFKLLETQLTAEDEELTPTMKLKRQFVQKKYAEMIDGMYRD